MYSLLQRISSLRHGLWFEVSERLRWSRGALEETPASELCNVELEQGERIAALRERYQVQFEQRLSARTSANNYEYLDILDRSWSESGLKKPAGGTLCDIGCASFWYAATLAAFFRPARLIGVEVEGYRLLRSGHARIDYATGYVRQLPNAEFVVADYTRYQQPADLITAWFPFLTPAALLAWRLPLRLLKPERLFEQIRHNLKPAGIFIMVNHGMQEWALAERLCTAAGLGLMSHWSEPSVLSSNRLEPPAVSWWRCD